MQDLLYYLLYIYVIVTSLFNSRKGPIQDLFRLCRDETALIINVIARVLHLNLALVNDRQQKIFPKCEFH